MLLIIAVTWRMPMRTFWIVVFTMEPILLLPGIMGYFGNIAKDAVEPAMCFIATAVGIFFTATGIGMIVNAVLH
jgi:hypothetical protein